jgi:hypothetical protein
MIVVLVCAMARVPARRAWSAKGDPAAAGEVQDVDAAGRARLADPDEVVLGTLEPGRHHIAVFVPAGPKGLPVPGVPGVGPGLDDIPDGQAVSEFGVHPRHDSGVAALPAANLLELGPWGMRPAAWDDLSLVISWRQFMRDPQSFFRHLLGEQDARR